MRPKKGIGLKDIASEVGVSVVTVSKALAGKAGVSDSLRKKVEAEAERLGYQRPEKKEQTGDRSTVGVIVAERFLGESQSFYWRVYQELSLRAGAERLFTLFEVVDAGTEKSEALPRLLEQRKADALLVLGPFHNGFLNRLAHEPIPMVCVDSQYEEISCDSVRGDNLLGGYLMTRHLLSLGHREIGFLGTLGATSSIDDRYLGYVKALMRQGIMPRREWVIPDRDGNGTIDAEGTFQLPGKGMPTAFFCNCDLSAMVLMRKLKDRGISVPSEVSVAGYDNYFALKTPEIPLTTYEIDIAGMADAAFTLLKQRIKEPEIPQQAVMLRGTFIPGESTAKR